MSDRATSAHRRWAGLFATGALIVALAGAATEPAGAQVSGTAADPDKPGTPIEIEADEGIEWRRDEKLYIARGNARAKRRDLEVRASVLSARYRDTADGGSEIWQIEANDNVRMTSPGRTVYADHAVYDLDRRVLRLDGGNLRIETGAETVTADDNMVYREKEQTVTAEGHVLVVRANREVRADRMVGFFERQADGKLQLVRMTADGNVEVKTTDTYARSAKGEYDLTTDIMILEGEVKVTSGQNQFNGEYAEVNVKTGVSRLLGGASKVKSLIEPSTDEQNP